MRLHDLEVGLGRRLHLYDLSGSGGDDDPYASIAVEASAVDGLGTALADDVVWDDGACAFADTQFLCAMTIRAGSFSDIHFRMLELDGGAVGAASTLIHDSVTLSHDPDVARIDDRFLVAWLDYASTQHDVLGRMVGLDGGLLVPTFPLSLSPQDEEDLALEGLGASTLAAWTELGATPTVRLAEVTVDGTARNLPVSFAGARSPALSWHDDEALVAVERIVDGGTRIEAYVLPAATLDEAKQVFVGPELSGETPALTRVDATRALLGYQVRQPDGGTRAFVTYVGLIQPGEGCFEDVACGQQASCVQGFCVLSPMALEVACGCSGGTSGLISVLLAGVALLLAQRRRRHDPRETTPRP